MNPRHHRLNLAEVARECQVIRKTVEGYLGILEDLLLAFRLLVFTRRARREVTAHPKLYFSDIGAFRALRSFRDDHPEAEPRLLYRGRETLEIEGIRCLPCESFLRDLRPGRLLP